MNTTPSIAISTRIPAEMVKGLDEVASLTERSRSFHIKKALNLYLINCKQQSVKNDTLQELDSAFSELNAALKNQNNLSTLDNLIDELEHRDLCINRDD
ncbi:ribbon-helix-helix domain-containing protein [Candidatus Thiodubiliella endoseptemdiera]|uniref:ribbon-helix-helix domain-containing protein n=1 Tax=Candidatus Thiodubiliella endoseptemdiera TaxID=2738886 RepID=UPI0034DEB9DE